MKLITFILVLILTQGVNLTRDKSNIDSIDDKFGIITITDKFNSRFDICMNNTIDINITIDEIDRFNFSGFENRFNNSMHDSICDIYKINQIGKNISSPMGKSSNPMDKNYRRTIEYYCNIPLHFVFLA